VPWAFLALDLKSQESPLAPRPQKQQNSGQHIRNSIQPTPHSAGRELVNTGYHPDSEGYINTILPTWP
jgi:hypothetical protein